MTPQNTHKHELGRRLAAFATLAAGLFIAGCGSSASTTATTQHPAGQAPAAATPASTTIAVKPSVRILAPAAGAHTGSTVTVHVRLKDAAAGAGLRYVLDGSLSRRGSNHLTYHELAPGRHRVVVTLTGDAHVRALRTFVVRAPVPAAAPAAPAAPAETAPSAPMGSERAPERTQPAERPPAVKPSNPPAGGGIPQGGGGDGDGDNSGGPSDGDGNV